MKRTIRVLISGGGTGGHIFPAISIANAIKVKSPDAEILFVGADNRMEMEKVPAAGYPIKGLPVSGLTGVIRWLTSKCCGGCGEVCVWLAVSCGIFVLMWR